MQNPPKEIKKTAVGETQTEDATKALSTIVQMRIKPNVVKAKSGGSPFVTIKARIKIIADTTNIHAAIPDRFLRLFSFVTCLAIVSAIRLVDCCGVFIAETG